jgi:quercetin dioxygenase-like cupin family protein
MRRMRLLVTLLSATLLPLILTSAQNELPPGPTAVFTSAFDVDDAAGGAQVITIVLDFEPNAWTPMHTHGGVGRVTVIEGELTRRTLEGEESTYGPGEGWLEAGEVEAAGNDTDQIVRVVFTILLPEGEQVTIAHED